MAIGACSEMDRRTSLYSLHCTTIEERVPFIIRNAIFNVSTFQFVHGPVRKTRLSRCASALDGPIHVVVRDRYNNRSLLRDLQFRSTVVRIVMHNELFRSPILTLIATVHLFRSRSTYVRASTKYVFRSFCFYSPCGLRTLAAMRSTYFHCIIS